MLGAQLPASGIRVIHSDGDTDVDVVSSALTVAKTCPVLFLGEGTDSLILLFWHNNPSLHQPVHLHSNSNKIFLNIKKSQKLLGDELTQSILAIHSFCDFDTTLRLHSVASRTVLQKCLKNQEFRNLLRVFSLPSSDGNLLLKKFTSSTGWQEGQAQHSVKVETLGPTSDISSGTRLDALDPLKWGW